MNPAGYEAAGRKDGSGPLGMLGTGSVIRKCRRRMQNPTYVVRVGPAHHAPRLLSGRAPSTRSGCKGHLGVCCRNSDLRCSPGHESPSVAHPAHKHLHVHTHRGRGALSQPIHACTHALELLPQAWERTCGPRKLVCLYFPLASFSSSWLFRPPGESQSLSPPTPPTHTHTGQARCTPRALV